MTTTKDFEIINESYLCEGVHSRVYRSKEEISLQYENRVVRNISKFKSEG